MSALHELILVYLLFISVIPIASKGTLSLRFMEYTESHNCDPAGACDLYFMVTVTGSSTKSFKTQQMKGGDSINFGKNIGVPNPFNVAFGTNGSVTVSVDVWDKDPGSDDKVRTVTKQLDYENMGPSETWTTVTVSHRNTNGKKGQLTMKYRIVSCDTHFSGKGCNYCDENYYSGSCSVFCRAEETQAANYTCQAESGARVCGWGRSPPDCSTCSPDYYIPNCTTHCVPVPGRYSCNSFTGHNDCLNNWAGEDCADCVPHYYGTNCSVYCAGTGSYTCTGTGARLCVGNRVNPAKDCSDCLAGYYGDECGVYCVATDNYTCSNNGARICSENREGDQCWDCKEHYYAPNCETFCKPGTNYSCTKKTPSLGSGSRGVTKSCHGNRAGPNCSTCKEGYYGTNCTVFCDGQHPNYTCSDDGTWTCSGNRTGESCDRCAADHYTVSCDVYCVPTVNYACNPVTGSKICVGSHRIGEDCDRCEKNYYGPRCLSWAPWLYAV